MGVTEKNDSFQSANNAELPPPSYHDTIPSYDEAMQRLPAAQGEQPRQTSFAADKKQQPLSASSAQQPSNASGSSSQSSRFPPQLNVYMHWSTFTLGPHQDEKLFTVIQTGLRKPMALVQGSNKNAPPLATIRTKGLGGTSILTIFPHEGGEVAEPLEITIENHSTRHSFCITLPNRRPQFFEWRSSKSDEVQALGAYKSGWKLVWLRSREEGAKGDEIVAASALNNSMSRSKGLKFGFFNSGLDGSLGDTFQIAAVTTASSDFEMFVTTNVAIAGNSASSATVSVQL